MGNRVRTGRIGKYQKIEHFYRKYISLYSEVSWIFFRQNGLNTILLVFILSVKSKHGCWHLMNISRLPENISKSVQLIFFQLGNWCTVKLQYLPPFSFGATLHYFCCCSVRRKICNFCNFVTTILLLVLIFLPQKS